MSEELKIAVYGLICGIAIGVLGMYWFVVL